MKLLLRSVIVIYLFGLWACQSATSNVPKISAQIEAETALIQDVIPGAERLQLYYPNIKDKRVGVVCNHASLVAGQHLIDTLLSMQVNVTTLMTPEHGLRGKADAGKSVKDGKDPLTGLPVVSLYGKNKKPSKEALADVDIVVFDLQDVGVRFYTYISTLHYVMEACAEAGIPIIVLDRPNPNGHYIDGPIREESLTSFVGMHPVPIVYGMTIGEYARMINGEGWLANGVKAELEVVSCSEYDHDTYYELPVKPSPNLPNIRSILLYPSLCLFEGTTVSVGRGTDKQFQIYGHPKIGSGSFSFTPRPMEGATHPKLEGKNCFGQSLQGLTLGSIYDRKKLDLTYLVQAYKELSRGNHPFFLKNNFFDKLAGTPNLRAQIMEGMTEEEIRASWQKDIKAFKEIRSKYLLYP